MLMNFMMIHLIDFLLITVYQMMISYQIITITIKIMNLYQHQIIIHMYMVVKMDPIFPQIVQIEEVIIQMNIMDYQHIHHLVIMVLHLMVFDIHFHQSHQVAGVVEMDDIQIIIIIKKHNVLY
jgi:hypothetical protein